MTVREQKAAIQAAILFGHLKWAVDCAVEHEANGRGSKWHRNYTGRLIAALCRRDGGMSDE